MNEQMNPSPKRCVFKLHIARNHQSETSALGKGGEFLEEGVTRLGYSQKVDKELPNFLPPELRPSHADARRGLY